MAHGIGAAAQDADPRAGLDAGQRVHRFDVDRVDHDARAIAHANPVTLHGTNLATGNAGSRRRGAVERDPPADPSRHRPRWIDVEARDAQIRLAGIDGRPGDRMPQREILDDDRRRRISRDSRRTGIVRQERQQQRIARHARGERRIVAEERHAPREGHGLRVWRRASSHQDSIVHIGGADPVADARIRPLARAKPRGNRDPVVDDQSRGVDDDVYHGVGQAAGLADHERGAEARCGRAAAGRNADGGGVGRRPGDRIPADRIAARVPHCATVAE